MNGLIRLLQIFSLLASLFAKVGHLLEWLSRVGWF